MKITLGDIYLLSKDQALQKLMEEDNINTELKWLLIDSIDDINNIIQEKLAKIEQVRLDLINKYGKENEDGSKSVTPENNGLFQAEINKLFAITTDFPDLVITRDMLTGNLKLNAVQIKYLLSLFKQQEKQKNVDEKEV